MKRNPPLSAIPACHSVVLMAGLELGDLLPTKIDAVYVRWLDPDYRELVYQTTKEFKTNGCPEHAALGAALLSELPAEGSA